MKNSWRHVLFVHLVLMALPFILLVTAPAPTQLFSANTRIPDAARFFVYAYSVLLLPSVIILRRQIIQRVSNLNPELENRRVVLLALVTAAFCLAPTPFGLLLYYLGGSAVDLYAGTAFSLLMFIIYFPRPGSWPIVVSKT